MKPRNPHSWPMEGWALDSLISTLGDVDVMIVCPVPSCLVSQQAKRARPPEDEAPSTGQQPAAFRAILKPFIAKLMQMKWTGWNNPFSTVLTKKNAPPRYFDFIKRPMNLTYIRDNLTKNKYYTVGWFSATPALFSCRIEPMPAWGRALSGCPVLWFP